MKLKASGEWCAWQKKHGLSRKTAFQAIRFFERAKTVEACSGLSLAEARRRLLGSPKGKKEEKRPTNKRGGYKRADPVPVLEECLTQLDAVRDALSRAADPIRVAALLTEIVSRCESLRSAAAAPRPMSKAEGETDESDLFDS